MKQRTTIMLPPDLKARAVKRARERGVSFGELVRESLDLILKPSRADERDELLRDRAVFSGKAPADLSAEHDRHLYGDE